MFEEKLVFKTVNFLRLAKALMNSYILCEIIRFSVKAALHKKYSIHRIFNPWGSKLCCALSIFRTNVFSVAPSEAVIAQANDMTQIL